ncbi:hypothetical protein OAL97_00410 [Paracoccaceae bacterium]|jgi:hypothetical protein|nr:hypothetical protein [Paracoccaceae bacterium]
MSVTMHNTGTRMRLIRVEHSAAPNEPKHGKRTDADRYQRQNHTTYGF